MQNAMNIMAMIQKSDVPKQKFDVPSKTLGNSKISFNKELSAVRKELAKDMGYDTKTVEANSQSTTENKLEKLVKVMSKLAGIEVQEKPTAESLEQLEADHAASSMDNTAELENLKLLVEDSELDEAIQSAAEIIQQLIQVVKDFKVEDHSDLETTECEDKLQGIIQKAEEALAASTPSQLQKTTELNNILTDMKTALNDLKTELASKPELLQNTKKIELLFEPLLEKLNQAETQMHQMLNKQSEEPQNTIQEIPEPVRKTAEVKETKAAKAIEPDDAKVLTEQGEVEPDKAIADNKAEKKAKDDRYTAKEEVNAGKTDAKNEVKLGTQMDKPNPNSLQDIPVSQTEKPSIQLNMKEMNTYLNQDTLVKIDSADIINQVIKKADIIVQDSHQEMVMKLEPESLGKLNLKVVVENGLVTAKFVAESQQVKEIIESNFNQLKDALQEKGIAVQNFSVSVNQEGSEFQSSQSFDQWKRSMKLSSRTSGEYLGLDDEIRLVANPYNYHEGKVDYRA